MQKRGRPPGSSGRAAVLTPQQIRAVLASARSRARRPLHGVTALALTLGLGLRAKELAALRWTDVYERDGLLRDVIHLKAAYTKGGKTRDVFLSSPRLRRVLEEYHEAHRPWDFETALLPSQKGGHLTPSSMARYLKDMYRDAGIPNASSHSGRRTMITQLAEKGIDLKSLSVIAGHANVRTTAMYVEQSPTRLARILQDVTW